MKSNRLSGRRKWWAALVVLVCLLAAGGAFAYFKGTASGSAQASVGTAVVSIAPGTASAQLYPGGSGDVVAVISNPAPVAVKVSSLALDSSQGTNGFDVAAGSGCADPQLSFSGPQTNGGSGWTIPPKIGTKDGSLTVTLTGAVHMGATASDGCQGATFDVYLKAGS